ncbi:MAG: sugar phosphate nucleotidyltransferase [Candidatus Thermoplasmatota archaeon]|jgi:bifunctional UDP-N-acetylglucosamine pyrophosphorylase/glucosamine-1-phosphate N-acetyltransferase|nr:sugar phosphate nucleotidyltransferase [Candidatus Thermoplasmatota archaeon]
MKALILAAGEGQRMGPLTENRPKPLLPVAGIPFLEHTVLALKEAGIGSVMVLTGYLGLSIKEHFGNGSRFGMDISYVVQPKQLGTANAVNAVRDLIDGPFLCVNGDVLLTGPLVKGLLDLHRKDGSCIMTLAQVEDASRFGSVKVEGGRVKCIIEKSGRVGPGLVNSGIYILKPSIFGHIDNTPLSTRGEYELTTSLELLMGHEEVLAYIPEVSWLDIGSPWDLLRAHEIYMASLKEDIRGKVEDGVHIHGKIVLKDGAVIRSGSYLEGNVIIDEGAVIGPNSFIRGSTYIGKGCKVGAFCEVKNSIVMDGTHIPHHNYVGDSIIGERCNLGSGTKVANLRLDEGPVPVTIKGKKVSSGRRKLGVIMGDDVKTGINATIDAGCMVHSGARIGPGARAKGTVLRDSRVL